MSTEDKLPIEKNESDENLSSAALDESSNADNDDGNNDGDIEGDVEEGPNEEKAGRKKNTVQVAVDTVTVLFPKLEPVPWPKFFFLTFLSAQPAVLYIILFTRMGIGVSTYFYLSENFEQYAYMLGMALGAFVFILYLLDFSYWESSFGTICRYLSAGVVIVGLCIFILFVSGEYPYGPISLFTVVVPIWFIFLNNLPFFDSVPTRTYISQFSGPLITVSFLVLISWITWTLWSDENEWNLVSRLEQAENSGCEPDFTDLPDCMLPNTTDQVCFIIDGTTSNITFPEGCSNACTDVFDACLNTFILWVGPLLVSISYMFLSFFSTFLRSSSSEQDILNFGKLWALLLFGMWVTASLAGAGAGVSTTLAALTLASFVASAVLLVSSFDQSQREEHFERFFQKIKEKYGSYFDIARGLLTVTCAPFAIIYVFLSFLKQCVRKLKFLPCSKRLDEEKEGGYNQWVTGHTARLINEFKSWDIAKVFTYAVYWGIAFMMLNVIVAQFTILFLSWLIEETSGMPIAAVTGIMIGVGLTMFLLPPVPGVPIYLTLGIVIVAVGRDSLGLVWSMVYATAVSLVLKIWACALQQKMIGEVLKGYVSVRQFVGINSKLIRSMKLVLGEKGLGIAKVSILVGGPDWPTSVLCGIMGLDLIPILIGTLPIIFLIIPTMLTGSFTYMASLEVDGRPEFPWAETVATVFAAFTAVVQFGSMVVATFYLEKAISTRQEELDAIPIDQEVLEAETKAEEIRNAYAKVTKWDAIPRWSKAVLILSLICMITSCYMVQLFQDDCFAEYSLTYTIEEDLDGDWTNLVLPLGLIAIILFIASMLFLKIFTSWATRKASKLISPENVPPSIEDEASTEGKFVNAVSTNS